MSALKQWEQLAEDSIQDAREWKARARAAEGALLDIAQRLGPHAGADELLHRCVTIAQLVLAAAEAEYQRARASVFARIYNSESPS
jgi:hypothetical protein